MCSSDLHEKEYGAVPPNTFVAQILPSEKPLQETLVATKEKVIGEVTGTFNAVVQVLPKESVIVTP